MLKVSEQFYAIVKKGSRSKTLDGFERAGRKLGPFTATKVNAWRIHAGDFKFSYVDFIIEKK